MHSFRTNCLVLLVVGATASCATERAVIGTAQHAPVSLEQSAPYARQAAVATSSPARTIEPAVVSAPVSTAGLARFTGLATNLTIPQIDARRPPGVESQHFMLLLGQRTLDDSIWGGVDEQFSVGFTFDKMVEGAPVSLDFGLHFSEDSTSILTGPIPTPTSIRSNIFEFDLGALKMFGAEGPGLRPYLGAGVALSWVSGRAVRFFLVDDTDFSPGYYGRVGVAYQAKGGGLIGLDFRYLGGTNVNLAGVSTDIDGWVGSLSFGYGI